MCAMILHCMLAEGIANVTARMLEALLHVRG